jgi:hypothetical protein
MKSVAVLNPDLAAGLVEVLQKAQIPCETRGITDEIGLEVIEVLVEDSQYDQACEASEQWQEQLTAEAQARSRRPCPKCRAPQSLERVHDEHYDEMGLVVFRCRDCGEAFPL